MKRESHDPIQLLSRLARRAANGEDVSAQEISHALAGLSAAPTHSRFELLLARLSRLTSLTGAATQRRVYHAARGLAGWLAVEASPRR